jgi:hypothetical protein
VFDGGANWKEGDISKRESVGEYLAFYVPSMFHWHLFSNDKAHKNINAPYLVNSVHFY